MAKEIKILVIDDEPQVRETICENLELCGYKVFDAADGEQGLELLYGGNRPHIVITDIIMPGKEGLETIMEIKKQFPDIRLIAMSGGGRTKAADFLKLAQKLGADASLPKPLDLDELEDIIDSLKDKISP